MIFEKLLVQFLARYRAYFERGCLNSHEIEQMNLPEIQKQRNGRTIECAAIPVVCFYFAEQSTAVINLIRPIAQSEHI